MPFNLKHGASQKLGSSNLNGKRFKPGQLCNMSSLTTKAKIDSTPFHITTLFDWTCDAWLSFDVETHALAPNSGNGWEVGSFGHLRRICNLSDIEALQIVQIGWTFGSFSSCDSPVTKSKITKPVNAELSSAATAIHKVTKEMILSQGIEIADALAEFLIDLKHVIADKGRICAHNLEFDATIVHEAMVTAVMHEDDIHTFDIAAHYGFCTFDPCLTHWCCKEYLQSSKKFKDDYKLSEVPVGLAEIVRVLDQEVQDSLYPKHNAGVDSRATWLVLQELHRLVRMDSANGKIGSDAPAKASLRE